MAVGPGPELHAAAPSTPATMWWRRRQRRRRRWRRQRVRKQFAGAQDERRRRWRTQSQSPPSSPFAIASPTVRSPSVQPVGRGRRPGRLPARFRLAQGDRRRRTGRRIQSRLVLRGDSPRCYDTAAVGETLTTRVTHTSVITIILYR